MRKVVLLLSLLALVAACRTIGITRTAAGFGEISPAIANEMILDHPQVVVIDFRTLEEYNGTAGHLAGALSVPLDSIETRLTELVPYTNSTILVYGSTGDEAERGATLLVAAGFRNVIVIQGGIDRWIELGYKTVTSI
jgi:rhodanese-related sulfurtransferase